MWLISMGYHGAAGVSQNAGVLVVLVFFIEVCTLEYDKWKLICGLDYGLTPNRGQATI